MHLLVDDTSMNSFLAHQNHQGFGRFPNTNAHALVTQCPDIHGRIIFQQHVIPDDGILLPTNGYAVLEDTLPVGVDDHFNLLGCNAAEYTIASACPDGFVLGGASDNCNVRNSAVL